MLDVELPEVDEERVAMDAAADLRAEEAAGIFSKDKKAAPKVVHSGEPLITAEEATQRLGSKVMAALADKFNGSLTDIRYPDESDMLF